ncbi:hypothetical protein AB9K26_08935 [Psychroserpens sp. XS_ASV72]|uniref:hypothetical protein n=1 Tax=Psychroserpens sp. XS_ASV72 TaxID=3241293 RepID=UPI0035115E68
MKLIATIVILCLATVSSFSQQLQINIKEGSDKPNTESEHLYLLEIKNDSKATANFTIKTTNVNCNEIDSERQTVLNHKALSKTSKREQSSYSLQPEAALEFYVKTMRPINTKLNTWNCTQVQAVNSNGRPISNTITIKSLIPDPKDQH